MIQRTTIEGISYVQTEAINCSKDQAEALIDRVKSSRDFITYGIYAYLVPNVGNPAVIGTTVMVRAETDMQAGILAIASEIFKKVTT